MTISIVLIGLGVISLSLTSIVQSLEIYKLKKEIDNIKKEKSDNE